MAVAVYQRSATWLVANRPKSVRTSQAPITSQRWRTRTCARRLSKTGSCQGCDSTCPEALRSPCGAVRLVNLVEARPGRYHQSASLSLPVARTTRALPRHVRLTRAAPLDDSGGGQGGLGRQGANDA